MTEAPYRLGIDEIRRFLPHRAPFLFVDRVLEIHPTGILGDMSSEGKVGTRVVAQKCVSYNEPYFQGHFPQFSIMPGVVILETLAQVSCFSLYPHMAKDIDRLARDFQCIFVGIDGVRFRKPVVPGDVLTLQTTVTKCRGKLWAFRGEAKVDGQLVAEADILANLIANTEGGTQS